jgi:phosphatidylinositol alpha-1,6-mannosyltransferase
VRQPADNPVAVCLFPGLSGENAGGIQGSGRLAWRAIADYAGLCGGNAGLLVYGEVGADDLSLARGRVASGASRLGILRAALGRPWSSPRLCFWHVALLKLLPLLRTRRARKILFLHGIEVWRPLGGLTRLLLDRIDHFLANSEFTWRRFLEFNPRFAGRPHTIVPLGWGDAEPVVLPPDATPAALMLGRMVRAEDYKGHREMIAAWPGVISRVPGAQLWIAGDGDLRPDLETLASKLGLAEAVRFCGRVSEAAKQELLTRCRCLALPSRGEGFGLVYLEAMRLGRPCLVSDRDAGREVVNPPEAGLATNPDDPAALAESVGRLLTGGDQWDGWSRGARLRYEAHFTRRHFQHRLIKAVFGSSVSCG